MSLTLPQETKIHGALKPAADAAGRNGRFVSLKNLHKLYVKVYVDQANAAVIPITITQAQAIAGTGAKVLATPVPIWANLDVAASDTLVRQADAVNFTTDAALKEKIVIFEILPTDLDVANGFDCIRVNTGASNVANITSAEYIGVQRYKGENTPSIIVD